jgi:hypothetical protein
VVPLGVPTSVALQGFIGHKLSMALLTPLLIELDTCLWELTGKKEGSAPPMSLPACEGNLKVTEEFVAALDDVTCMATARVYDNYPEGYDGLTIQAICEQWETHDSFR